MAYEVKQFKASDGVTISYHRWVFDGNEPRAVLVIAHGMAEHGARYSNFASYANAQGFRVYVPDHRGHGITAGTPEKTGFFAPKNGWWKVVDDLQQMLDIATRENPKKNVFLMGHSMGSFLVRTYICRNQPQIAGVILSGTGMNPKLLLMAGKAIAQLSIRLKGRNHPSKLLDSMSFGKFNKGFVSPFQWLSRDQSMVDAYIADAFCGQVFTTGFFSDLFDGLLYIGNDSNLTYADNTLPVLVISGTDDPVGDYGKSVKKVFAQLQKAGFDDLQLKMYQGARHELINEINRDDVYKDIIEWLKNKNLHYGA